MPHIEVIGPTADDRQPRSAYGTRLRVDGRDIPDVREIVLRAALDAALTVRAEVLVTNDFHFEGEAALQVTVVAAPGYTVVEETRSDGTKAYRAEKAK